MCNCTNETQLYFGHSSGIKFQEQGTEAGGRLWTPQCLTGWGLCPCRVGTFCALECEAPRLHRIYRFTGTNPGLGRCVTSVSCSQAVQNRRLKLVGSPGLYIQRINRITQLFVYNTLKNLVF